MHAATLLKTAEHQLTTTNGVADRTPQPQLWLRGAAVCRPPSPAYHLRLTTQGQPGTTHPLAAHCHAATLIGSCTTATALALHPSPTADTLTPLLIGRAPKLSRHASQHQDVPLIVAGRCLTASPGPTTARPLLPMYQRRLCTRPAKPFRPCPSSPRPCRCAVMHTARVLTLDGPPVCTQMCSARPHPSTPRNSLQAAQHAAESVAACLGICHAMHGPLQVLQHAIPASPMHTAAMFHGGAQATKEISSAACALRHVNSHDAHAGLAYTGYAHPTRPVEHTCHSCPIAVLNTNHKAVQKAGHSTGLLGRIRLTPVKCHRRVLPQQQQGGTRWRRSTFPAAGAISKPSVQ
jgi:hypothetical protein